MAIKDLFKGLQGSQALGQGGGSDEFLRQLGFITTASQRQPYAGGGGSSVGSDLLNGLRLRNQKDEAARARGDKEQALQRREGVLGQLLDDSGQQPPQVGPGMAGAAALTQDSLLESLAARGAPADATPELMAMIRSKIDSQVMGAPGVDTSAPGALRALAENPDLASAAMGRTPQAKQEELFRRQAQFDQKSSANQELAQAMMDPDSSYQASRFNRKSGELGQLGVISEKIGREEPLVAKVFKDKETRSVAHDVLHAMQTNGGRFTPSQLVRGERTRVHQFSDINQARDAAMAANSRGSMSIGGVPVEFRFPEGKAEGVRERIKEKFSYYGAGEGLDGGAGDLSAVKGYDLAQAHYMFGAPIPDKASITPEGWALGRDLAEIYRGESLQMHEVGGSRQWEFNGDVWKQELLEGRDVYTGMIQGQPAAGAKMTADDQMSLVSALEKVHNRAIGKNGTRLKPWLTDRFMAMGIPRDKAETEYVPQAYDGLLELWAAQGLGDSEITWEKMEQGYLEPAFQRFLERNDHIQPVQGGSGSPASGFQRRDDTEMEREAEQEEMMGGSIPFLEGDDFPGAEQAGTPRPSSNPIDQHGEYNFDPAESARILELIKGT